MTGMKHVQHYWTYWQDMLDGRLLLYSDRNISLRSSVERPQLDTSGSVYPMRSMDLVRQHIHWQDSKEFINILCTNILTLWMNADISFSKFIRYSVQHTYKQLT